jgi:hypothetical protein
MEQQLRSLDVDLKDFRAAKPEEFFVLRFRPRSLNLLEIPVQFSKDDPTVRTNRYVLLNQNETPRLPKPEFKFVPGHSEKKNAAESTYAAQSRKIDLVQNHIQETIYRQLADMFGKANVRTEMPVGEGPRIDIVVKDGNGGFSFYEIKISYSVRLSIREAFGQLLEYAYYRPAIQVNKLVVVSDRAIPSEAKTYMEFLRKRFGLPIYYQRYDAEREALENTLH